MDKADEERSVFADKAARGTKAVTAQERPKRFERPTKRCKEDDGLPIKDPPKMPQVRPAGMGTFGRLKGHAYSLRRQIKRLAKQLKVPVPEDTFAHRNLPMPINDDGTPGSEQGQAGAIMKKLSALVNQIAVTKNRHIIAELNREVDSLTAKLRTMTVGAHCLACGKAHCHVNARDAAQLWPKPRRCGCNDLAHPGCPCP